MPNTATRPDLSNATQKERALWHMKEIGEIDRKVALDEYGIGRLAARIRDLRDDGYVIDSRKDADGIAHYSLVAEPGEDVPFQSAEGLLEYLEGTHALAHSYVQLLLRAATEGYPVGVQEDTTWDAEALSDWEAAASLSADVTVQDIAEVRGRLCQGADLVVRDGYRVGQPTFRLHGDLL